MKNADIVDQKNASWYILVSQWKRTYSHIKDEPKWRESALYIQSVSKYIQLRQDLNRNSDYWSYLEAGLGKKKMEEENPHGPFKERDIGQRFAGWITFTLSMPQLSNSLCKLFIFTLQDQGIPPHAQMEV